ncbi:hypothetical protein V2G26_000458 [Clonostachys chloroleuca]
MDSDAFLVEAHRPRVARLALGVRDIQVKAAARHANAASFTCLSLGTAVQRISANDNGLTHVLVTLVAVGAVVVLRTGSDARADGDGGTRVIETHMSRGTLFLIGSAAVRVVTIVDGKTGTVDTELSGFTLSTFAAGQGVGDDFDRVTVSVVTPLSGPAGRLAGSALVVVGSELQRNAAFGDTQFCGFTALPSTAVGGDANEHRRPVVANADGVLRI